MGGNVGTSTGLLLLTAGMAWAGGGNRGLSFIIAKRITFNDRRSVDGLSTQEFDSKIDSMSFSTQYGLRRRSGRPMHPRQQFGNLSQSGFRSEIEANNCGQVLASMALHHGHLHHCAGSISHRNQSSMGRSGRVHIAKILFNQLYREHRREVS